MKSRWSVAVWFEYAGFAFFMMLCRLLGVRRASDVGGGLMRMAGRLIPETNIGYRNMHIAFPDMDARARKALFLDACETVGRIVAELPHIAAIYKQRDIRIELKGTEYAHAALERGKGVVFASGHFSNPWVLGMAVAALADECAIIYRYMDNPYIRPFFVKSYAHFARHPLPKGHMAVREMLKLLRRGVPVAMLSDRRLNEGVAVDFFGHEVMAPDGAAMMALRCDSALIPYHAYRVEKNGDKVHFIVEFFPPIIFDETQNKKYAIQKAMQDFYVFLEERIKQRPEDWLWFHHRWKARPKRKS